jgi:hypothetical protein
MGLVGFEVYAAGAQRDAGAAFALFQEEWGLSC